MYILDKVKLFVDKILFVILFLIIALILVCVCLQVFYRYFLQSPIIFTEELVRFLLIWLGLLGASYTFGIKGHISLTILLDRVPKNIHKVLIIIIDLLILASALLILIIGGIELMKVTKMQTSSVLGVPIWSVYSAVTISGFLTAFYQICFIIRNIKNMIKGE